MDSSVLRSAGRPPERAREFEDALASVSRAIEDPAAKLRFLRASLERYAGVERAVSRLPLAPLRRLLYGAFGLERLRRMLEPPPRAHDRRAPARSGARRAAAVAVVLIAGGALAVAAQRGLRASAPLAPAAVPLPAARPAAQAAARPLPPVAEPAPPGLEAPMPAQVWLVEQGQGYEQYSNGLRIETRYALAGPARHYRVFDLESGDLGAPQDRPVGILFHTSESDMWPMEAAYNANLRDSSQLLLRYIRRLSLYNYVVDRFGRVYRVVEESARANHAGFSVWSARRGVYLNLNNAFLGICFESRWEGGRTLPITRAQLAAGRALSDYLRRRYDIAADMCVTHGLTSVNPHGHLIGHHVDWARGFPFAAFDLPDHYEDPAPAVALFGFGYDEEFLKAVGEPWKGVAQAERLLGAEAQRRGLTLQDLRHERQARYDRWLAQQRHEDETRDPVERASGGEAAPSGAGAIGPGTAPGDKHTRGSGG